MAKVKGPLFSLEARGRIGDAMVHFPWKGRFCVRRWLKPTNPRDVDQKIIRQKLAAMGKNTVVIETPKTGLEDGSKMYQMLKDVTIAGQIWNAYFAKQTLDYIKTDSNMTSLLTDFFQMDSTAATHWGTAATTLGMAALTGPEYATEISPGFQLFLGAYAAYKLALSSYTDKYNVHPSTWTSATIANFATDYYTVK